MFQTVNKLKMGNITSFKQYSQFKSRDDFNKNIEMFLAVHKKEFTKMEYIAFRRLTKFAGGEDTPGLATAKVETLLRSVKERDFSFGISESTVHRMRRKAIRLGILETRETTRQNSSYQSSNLWIFRRFDSKQIVSKQTTIDTPEPEAKQPKPVSGQGIIVRQMTLPLTNKLLKTTIKKQERYYKEPSATDYQDYFETPQQEKLYKLIKASPFPPEVKRNAGKLVLRAADSTIQTAFQAVHKVAEILTDGCSVKNPVALFTAELKRERKPFAPDSPPRCPVEQARRTALARYDWVNEGAAAT